MFHLKKCIGLLAILLVSFSVGRAQSDSEDLAIKLIAVSDGSDLFLRWAPQNFTSWDWGNVHGYKLERITLESNGTALTDQQQISSYVLLSDNLKPLPKANWETIINTSDIAGVAAGAIYGEDFTVADPDSADIVQFYNVDRENENRFGFSLFAADQSFELAEMMGLAFRDVTAQANEKYLYGVTFMGPVNPQSVEHGLVETGLGDTQNLPAPAGLEGVAGDQAVQLSWDAASSSTYYTSYVVEKSDDNGATFYQVSTEPVVNTSTGEIESEKVFFLDSLAVNNQPYQYRVKGKTPFGIYGPTSAVVEVSGKPAPLAARPFVNNVKEDMEGILTVRWSFPTNLETEIGSFELHRADKQDGDYTTVTAGIGVSVREYVDNTPLPLNYYKIVAIDNNGYPLTSFPAMGQLNDETPPAAPAGLSCEVSAAGLVTISWDENSEADVMGYRVFTSNQPTTEYAQVTTDWIRDNEYQHQINLNSLSESVYYKVLALDYRENYSDKSEYCIVTRPDIIPPAPPHLVRADPSMSGVTLEWRYSSSADVVRHVLERKATHETSWEELNTYIPGDLDSVFVDSVASFAYVYDYRMLAYDDGELQSSSIVLRTQPIDNGIREAVTPLQSYAVPLDSTNVSTPGSPVTYGDVYVGWVYPTYLGLADFVVYRKKNQNPMMMYKHLTLDSAAVNGSLPGSHTEVKVEFGFSDEEVKSGNTYEYRIMARFANGAQSELSPPMIVSF